MIEEGKSLRNIDKPIYNFWQAIYYSFFSSKLYLDVGKRWKGLGLIYLLLIIFLMSTPFTSRLVAEFLSFYDDKIIQPIRDLPVLYVQEGKVSLNQPMPFYVKNKKNEVVAIVDTTGAITAIDKKYPDLVVLITKDSLIYKYPILHPFFDSLDEENMNDKVHVFSLAGDNNFVFDAKQSLSESLVNKLKYFFAVLLYPTIAIVAFSSFLVLILTIAFLGQLISKLFFDFSISYSQSSRLLIVSMTPFMLIFWIVLAFGYFSRSHGFILPLLVIFYFCYAVLALKRGSQKLVRL